MTTRVQVAKGTSVTLTETFSVDGAPLDLDSGVPTITALYPDGTAVSPAPTASGAWTGRTTGQYRIVLDAEAEVTYLDPITWTGVIGGKTQKLYSRVEWVGELLFTIGEFRALRVGGGLPFATTAVPLFSDAQIHQARAEVLEELTDILGVSPVPRFARETVSVGYGSTVVLRNLLATDVLSVSVAGVAQSASGYLIDTDNRLLPVSNYAVSPWTSWGFGNLTVEYVHGWPRPKGNGGRMAMMMAAAQLSPSLYSSATTVSTADGETYTYEPSEMGRDGFVRYTGIRPVDRWLHLHRQAGAVVA